MGQGHEPRPVRPRPISIGRVRCRRRARTAPKKRRRHRAPGHGRYHRQEHVNGFGRRGLAAGGPALHEGTPAARSAGDAGGQRHSRRLTGPRRAERRRRGPCPPGASHPGRRPPGRTTGRAERGPVWAYRGWNASRARNGPRLLRQPQPHDNAGRTGDQAWGCPGPVSGMHRTRAEAPPVNAARCGP
jgi:hypothetical protein